MLQRYSSIGHSSASSGSSLASSSVATPRTAAATTIAVAAASKSTSAQSVVAISPENGQADTLLNMDCPLEPDLSSGMVDTSDMGLLNLHPHLPRAPIESAAMAAYATNVLAIENQLGRLSVVAGVSEIAERAALKKRDRLRLQTERAMDEEAD